MKMNRAQLVLFCLSAVMIVCVGLAAGPTGATGAPPEASGIPMSENAIYLPFAASVPCVSVPFNESLALVWGVSRVQAPHTWACSFAGDAVTVAVIDTGGDLDHPDLAANIVGSYSAVFGESPEDVIGHGTHVAGTVAAVANNGGVVGVAPQVNLLVVKVFTSDGYGFDFDVAQGINWAVANGADVINMSLGGPSDSFLIKSAIQNAAAAGVTLVAAAGNCGDSGYPYNGCSYQDQPLYPAAYAEVIAVAATTESNAQASFSNAGSYVELAAPGVNTYSTCPDNAYCYSNGTSMASPHVAGVAAILHGASPWWTSAEVRGAMQAGALDLGAAGWDPEFGYGLVQTQRALLQPASLAAMTVPTEPSLEGAASGPFVAGELVVGLSPGYSWEAVMAGVDLGFETELLEAVAALNVVRVAVPEGSEDAVINALSGLAGVQFVERHSYRVVVP